MWLGARDLHWELLCLQQLLASAEKECKCQFMCHLSMDYLRYNAKQECLTHSLSLACGADQMS